MSSNARAERRRSERAQKKRHHVHPEGDYGTQPGWFATLDDLEEAKKLSHDLLIASMGDRRTGGVQWRYWTGDDATRVLRDYTTTGGPWKADEWDILRRIRAHLREYGGYLIIAMAEGTP